LATFDADGTGPNPPRLIAGGLFSGNSGPCAAFVAQWNGVGWLPLGTGTNGAIYALLSFDFDGEGPEPEVLFAGGAFTAAGGTAASHVALWN
jgi:hypothetical protein